MNMKELCSSVGITVIPEKWDDDGAAVITLGSLRKLAEQAALMAIQSQTVEKPKTNKPDLYFELKDGSRRYYDVSATKIGTLCPNHEDEDYIETIWSISITSTDNPSVSISFEIHTPFDQEPSPLDIASFILSEVTPPVVMALSQANFDSFKPVGH